MGRKGTNAIVTILVLVVLMIIGFFAFRWISDRNPVSEPVPTVNETTDKMQEEDQDLLSKIVDNPDQYYGQTVTVRGEIQDLFSRRVFKISNQTVGDELLVVTKNPLTESQTTEAEELFEDNADVEATGTLRRLTTAEIEQEFNLDLSQELEVEFQDRPVLVADRFSFGDNQPVFDFSQGPQDQPSAQ